MPWDTEIEIGVFWDGGKYRLKQRPWLWLAKLCARYELAKFPYRRAAIAKAKGE